MKKHNPHVSKLAAELAEAADRMTPQRRAQGKALVDAIFPDEVTQLIEELTPLPASGVARELVEQLREAIRAGFLLALGRYGKELKNNAEAVSIINGRKAGVSKGHTTQSQAREIKYQHIRDTWAALEAAGERPTNATVAARVRETFKTKCSARTVQRAFAEPVKKTTPAKRTKR